jgi:hypothetical protein
MNADATRSCDQDLPSPVGDRETDVDRRDDEQSGGTHDSRVEPPERERREHLKNADDEAGSLPARCERSRLRRPAAWKWPSSATTGGS